MALSHPDALELIPEAGDQSRCSRRERWKGLERGAYLANTKCHRAGLLTAEVTGSLFDCGEVGSAPGRTLGCIVCRWPQV